jgi:hypothetical protein
MRVLLMTGTLVPGADTPLLARADVADRLADYRRSLAFHLGLLEAGALDRLVFVENSGRGMEALADLAAPHGGRVELISYAAPPVPPEGSRLAAEFELLQEGWRRSAIIAEAPAGTMIWKITGRYLWENLAETIRRAPGGLDAHLHCRNLPRRYVDFAHAGYGREAGPEIFAALLQGEMGVHYMDWVRDQMEDGVLARFRLRQRLSPIPRMRGRRGVDGARWEGPAQRARYAVRAAAAALAPRLWI